jgi:predicted transcriptional regulator
MPEPPRMPDEDVVEFTVRMHKTELLALREIAQETNRSIKSVARRAIQRMVHDHKCKKQDDERAGLARFLANAERTVTIEEKQ